MMGSITYPEIRKGLHAPLYCGFCTLSPCLEKMMGPGPELGPVMGPVMGLYTFIIILLYVRAHRIIACRMLCSRLSRCIATIVWARTPQLSALAVTSIRSVHC